MNWPATSYLNIIFDWGCQRKLRYHMNRPAMSYMNMWYHVLISLQRHMNYDARKGLINSDDESDDYHPPRREEPEVKPASPEKVKILYDDVIMIFSYNSAHINISSQISMQNSFIFRTTNFRTSWWQLILSSRQPENSSKILNLWWRHPDGWIPHTPRWG